jgi:hypothetical protein
MPNFTAHHTYLIFHFSAFICGGILSSNKSQYLVVIFFWFSLTIYFSDICSLLPIYLDLGRFSSLMIHSTNSRTKLYLRNWFWGCNICSQFFTGDQSITSICSSPMQFLASLSLVWQYHRYIFFKFFWNGE